MLYYGILRKWTLFIAATNSDKNTANPIQKGKEIPEDPKSKTNICEKMIYFVKKLKRKNEKMKMFCER